MNTIELKNALIFHSMTEKEMDEALCALNANEKKYPKGAAVLHSGDTTEQMGLVLEGSVTIENNDIWGNKTILSHVGKGEFFAETYGLLADEPLLVDVVTNEKSRILFLRIGSLRNIIISGEPWAYKLISNLLTISMHKNLTLSGRSFHTSPKTIRGRVMSYLNTISLRTGKVQFDIPFDRQQMADYLNVERTALSKELAKMESDGLLRFRKNHFELLAPDSF